MSLVVKCEKTCRQNSNGFCIDCRARQYWADWFDEKGIKNPDERKVLFYNKCDWVDLGGEEK